MANTTNHRPNRLARTALWQRVRSATQTWTPSVGFGLVVCALIGVSLISEQIQHAVSPSDSYTQLSRNHVWVIGVIFIALYVLGVIAPVRGALAGVGIFCAIGFAAALPHRNIVGLIFYAGLLYTAIMTTRKKQRLFQWLRWQQAKYESERSAGSDGNGIGASGD